MIQKKFNWPIRVYYEDTDAGGVVYHSNYLSFMERARTEWLRSLGIEQDQLIELEGIIFAVRSLSVAYIKPALFNQELVVESYISKLGKASITFQQNIFCSTTEELLVEASVKIACINAIGDIKKAKVIPDNLYQLFLNYGHNA